MRPTLRTPLGLVLLSLAVACAHPLSQADRERLEQEARAQFPDKRFIVGFGEGPSRAEAEARARAQVASFIQSDIQESLGALKRARVANGRGEETTDVSDVLETRVNTSFGAYILPRSAREAGGTWHAVAAADRAPLDAAIEAEATKHARDAEPLWRRIAEATSWLDAAPSWCGAAAAAKELDLLEAERLAVSKRSVWTDERARLWAAASRRRAAARSTLVIQVTAGDVVGAQDPSPMMLQALQAAGWRAAKGEPSRCAGEALAVDARLERECRHSSLGIEACKATMVVEGRACAGAGSLFAERSPQAQATDSTDPEAAFRRAAGQVAVKPTVERVLAKVLAAVGDGCSAGPAPGAAPQPMRNGGNP